MTTIAVLSDIHGNLPAFEAALKDVAQVGADQIVLLGDVVNGAPDSAGCWQRALELECPILRGNHERYVADWGTDRALPEWESERFGPLRWTVGQLAADQRAAMGRLPLVLRLPAAPDILFVHASARNDSDSIYSHTSADLLEEMFGAAAPGYIVRGHNHFAQTRLWDRGVIWTNGSVGNPMDHQTTAQYTLLIAGEGTGWRALHRSVPYDLAGLLARFRTSGYLDAAGPMARLFMREMATATYQMVPFLRAWRTWPGLRGLELHQALERFLNFY